MKKEIFNILFLSVVVSAVAWLYWPQNEAPERFTKSGVDSYVLALSWQPAFCERKPNRPECRSQHERRYDANNFSLHGLWPQPRDYVYCNIPKDIVELDKRGRWSDLPKKLLPSRLLMRWSEALEKWLVNALQYLASVMAKEL